MLNFIYRMLTETFTILFRFIPLLCRDMMFDAEPLRNVNDYKQAVREAAAICPRPCKLTFDLLTLKVVSESRVTWATFVPILVFLGLCVLDLGPMYATDRQSSDRQTSDAHHNAPYPRGRGIIKQQPTYLLTYLLTVFR